MASSAGETFRHPAECYLLISPACCPRFGVTVVTELAGVSRSATVICSGLIVFEVWSCWTSSHKGGLTIRPRWHKQVRSLPRWRTFGGQGLHFYGFPLKAPGAAGLTTITKHALETRYCKRREFGRSLKTAYLSGSNFRRKQRIDSSATTAPRKPIAFLRNRLGPLEKSSRRFGSGWQEPSYAVEVPRNGVIDPKIY